MTEFPPEAERLALDLWADDYGPPNDAQIDRAQRAIDAGWVHRDDLTSDAAAEYLRDRASHPRRPRRPGGRTPEERVVKVQIGWIPDYIAWDVAGDEDLDGVDLDILGLNEVAAGTTFTVNSSPTVHHYLPVYVEIDQ